MELPSDEELMRRGRAGDKAAFGTLVERLWWPAVRYCLSLRADAHLAQDLAQEGFIRLYCARTQYDPQVSRVRTLLNRILYNLAVDQFRRARTQDEALLRLVERTEVSEWLPSDAIESKEQMLSIYRALQALTPEQRWLVVLREFQGLSYREMAEATGMTFDTVRVQLHRARKRMQQELRDEAAPAGEARSRANSGP